jgi:hypothetical protein
MKRISYAREEILPLLLLTCRCLSWAFPCTQGPQFFCITVQSLLRSPQSAALKCGQHRDSGLDPSSGILTTARLNLGENKLLN